MLIDSLHVHRMNFRNDSAESVPPRRPAGMDTRNECSSSFFTGLIASLWAPASQNKWTWRAPTPVMKSPAPLLKEILPFRIVINGGANFVDLSENSTYDIIATCLRVHAVL